MDQPVRARPHAQPISRDAGCAAIRADPHMAADRHATARTSLAATEAIRAARPATGKPPPSAVVRQASRRAFPGPDGRSAGHGERADDPVERLLADAVPTGRA